MEEKTFWLLVGIWDEEKEDYRYLKYEVPVEWLKENVYNLEEFMEEYTTDESTGLYEQAVIDDIVINERWVE
jgi:hypothetical protein